MPDQAVRHDLEANRGPECAGWLIEMVHSEFNATRAGKCRPLERGSYEALADALATERGLDDERVELGNHGWNDDWSTRGCAQAHVHDTREGAVRSDGEPGGVVGLRHETVAERRLLGAFDSTK